MHICHHLLVRNREKYLLLGDIERTRRNAGFFVIGVAAQLPFHFLTPTRFSSTIQRIEQFQIQLLEHWPVEGDLVVPLEKAPAEMTDGLFLM